VLIIYAHPNKSGHSGAILKEVERFLGEKKIKYEILDLYEMGYDPVLHANELYTSGQKGVSRETKIIQEKIKKQDKFIFIYPVWWNNMPAILKGFFDKIFTSRFAFKYVGRWPKGLLGGRAVVFSSSGAPRLFVKLLAGDRALKVVTRDILKFAGIKSRAYLVGRANKFNEKQKEKIRKMVRKGLKFLIS